jgi:hypothetical protein
MRFEVPRRTLKKESRSEIKISPKPKVAEGLIHVHNPWSLRRKGGLCIVILGTHRDPRSRSDSRVEDPRLGGLLFPRREGGLRYSGIKVDT